MKKHETIQPLNNCHLLLILYICDLYLTSQTNKYHNYLGGIVRHILQKSPPLSKHKSIRGDASPDKDFRLTTDALFSIASQMHASLTFITSRHPALSPGQKMPNKNHPK